MVDLAVRGGRLISGGVDLEADLYIDEGRIVGMGRLDLAARVTVDARGLLVLPGIVDAHVHFMDPGDSSREDFPHGSAAAATAGVTTVLEHTHAQPVHTASQLREKAEYLRDRSCVDFGLAAHFSPRGLPEVADVWEGGAAFIKVFTCTTHGISAVGSGRLYQALEGLAASGAVFLVHAEDEDLTLAAEEGLKAAGRLDGGVLPHWRSPLAEEVAVASVARMALSSGARVVIAHCSHPAVVEIVDEYRRAGADLWAESCPQYFLLYEEEAAELGGLRKFTPPARAVSEGDLRSMWDHLQAGRIHYVASDHAPSTRAQKLGPSIWDVPFGLPGVETTFPLMLDAALEGRLTLSRLSDACSTAPARLYGLYPRKGALLPGSDADFVLIDPEGSRLLEDGAILSRAGWTPYHGRRVRGTIVATYLRGQKVAEAGRCLAEPGTGRFIPGAGARAPGARGGGWS